MLSSRVRCAISGKAEILATRSSGLLVPYVSVQSIISTHPVVVHLKLVSKDVYSALLVLHARMQQQIGQREGRETDDSHGCISCGQYDIRIDEHNGCNVCQGCGAVQERMAINVTMEYVQRERSREKSAVRGVATWIMKKNQSQSYVEGAHRSSYWHDLEHWNHYTNISEDELSYLDNMLNEWKDGGIARDVRLGACLLYPSIKDKLNEEDDIRKRLQEKKPLRQVARVSPAATFKCSICHASCFTMKSAKFHCGRMKVCGKRGKLRLI